jgi:S-methylmethionine-dependent homocysteine/selenocysteine methylase
VAGEPVDPDDAAAYHALQIEAFAVAGADLVTALTLTGTGEAVGIVRAARSAGLPVAVSFTVEQDGRLPDGTPLHAAAAAVDAEAPPDYFMVNCAHPQPHRARPGRRRRLAVPDRRPARQRLTPQPRRTRRRH